MNYNGKRKRSTLSEEHEFTMEERIKVFSQMIREQDIQKNRALKLKYLGERAKLLYQTRQWKEALEDFNIIESSIHLNDSFKVMKLKAQIQESFRQHRLNVEQTINISQSSPELDSLYECINEDNVDLLLNNYLVENKGSASSKMLKK